MVTLKGHTAEITSAAYSPDGKRIVSASFDKSLRIWEAVSGQELLTLKGHTGPVNRVAYSSDGNHIVSSGLDGTIRIWDATPME